MDDMKALVIIGTIIGGLFMIAYTIYGIAQYKKEQQATLNGSQKPSSATPNHYALHYDLPSNTVCFFMERIDDIVTRSNKIHGREVSKYDFYNYFFRRWHDEIRKVKINNNSEESAMLKFLLESRIGIYYCLFIADDYLSQKSLLTEMFQKEIELLPPIKKQTILGTCNYDVSALTQKFLDTVDDEYISWQLESVEDSFSNAENKPFNGSDHGEQLSIETLFSIGMDNFKKEYN